jgi:hypothetical protein
MMQVLLRGIRRFTRMRTGGAKVEECCTLDMNRLTVKVACGPTGLLPAIGPKTASGLLDWSAPNSVASILQYGGSKPFSHRSE